MSRPRSADPGVPITISIPNSLKMRLDKELSWKQSRSKWVTKAIEAKFLDMAAFDMSDISNARLIHVFHSRICGCMSHETCVKMNMLKGALPIEETEAGQ